MMEVKLNQVCKILNGFAFKSEEYQDDGIPLLRISNFDDGDVVVDDKSIYVDKSFLKTKKDFIVEKGDILIALSGATTGKYGIYNYDFPSLLNQRIGLIKSSASNKLSGKYFYHYLNILKGEILRKAGGAAQPNISTKTIGELEIPLPPLPQQQKIANILDAAATLKQNDKALIAKYDALTQALFLEMFGDVISNSKNWESKKFEEIISLKRGYDLPNNDRKKGDIPVVASTGIVGFHNEIKVKGGCIVTGRSGSIGKVQLITVDCWPLNTSLYGYKTFNNNLVYLKYFVSYFRIERFSHGAGVPTLDRKLVHKELAPIPPIELQNQFAARVALIEQQKAIAQKSLEKSEALCNSLLQKAFNGGLT